MAIIKVDYGNVGGSPKLLWEGDGTLPTTITLNESVENFTHLIFHFACGDGVGSSYGICAIDNYPLMYFGVSYVNNGTYLFGRKFSYSGKSLTFAQTSFEQGTDGTSGSWQNNTYAIPLKIYGVNIDS